MDRDTRSRLEGHRLDDVGAVDNADVDALFTGTMSRRELVRRGSAFGLSASTIGALLAACGSNSPGTTTGKPKRGGTLRAGFSGGGSTDTLNGLGAVTTVSICYASLLFDSLITYDADARMHMALAEEITPNKDATIWTIRVKRGVMFHDGKELTAEDVIYTFQQIANPKSPQSGASLLSGIELSKMKKVDKYTAEIPFAAPYSTFPEGLFTAAGFPIVPVDFDPKHPVGTGPFEYESFAAGVQAEFARNPNYWQSGLPYVDAVKISTVTDESAQVNGLTSGTYDIVNALSAASKASVENAGSKVAISDGGAYVPFTMRTDSGVFSDVRVRQAFRLMVDRPAMREAVFAGHGALGNDVFCIWSPEYDDSLPQRQQDLDRAKSLLRQAGQQDLHVELVTSPLAPGAVQSAQVMAEQAKGAGVRVNLSNVPVSTFYGPNYLKWGFAQDYWAFEPFFAQVATSSLPNSPFNECRFTDEQFIRLNRQALASTSEEKRTEIAHEMQRILYDRGGYIIPFFAPLIDGYTTRVGGVTQSKLGLPFNSFDLKSLWLA